MKPQVETSRTRTSTAYQLSWRSWVIVSIATREDLRSLYSLPWAGDPGASLLIRRFLARIGERAVKIADFRGLFDIGGKLFSSCGNPQVAETSDTRKA